MWLLRGALLGAVLVALHDAAADPQYEDTEDDDGDDVDFDDHYDSKDIITATPPVTATDEPGARSRVRRFGDFNPGERTLSLDEISEVKGALKELLAGRYQDLTATTFTSETSSSEAATDVNEPVTKDPAFTGLTKIDNLDPTKYYEDIIEEIIDNAKRQGLYVLTRTNGWANGGDSDGRDKNDDVLPPEGPEVETTVASNKLDSQESGTAPTGETPTIETTTGPTTRKRTRRRRTTTTPTTTTTSTTTPMPDIDIPALVDIIANLTYDFESNITFLFNQTLQRYNIPTCKTPTEPPTTPPPFYNLRNATVVSKCFVCGMHEEGIPRNAHCADAFAGDFLPLVPVDQRAKGQLAKFRKYCRYLDLNGFYENATEPRSIYGRFTGGCSVRWTDLSGVYTQRACRNTRRAMTGRHFGSKRMAKLELSLKDFDNGCIISPMASLVPLSRGISLYARFHACVCTGNWCNAASAVQPWVAFIAVVAFLGLTMNTGSSIGNMFLA